MRVPRVSITTIARFVTALLLFGGVVGSTFGNVDAFGARRDGATSTARVDHVTAGSAVTQRAGRALENVVASDDDDDDDDDEEDDDKGDKDNEKDKEKDKDKDKGKGKGKDEGKGIVVADDVTPIPLPTAAPTPAAAPEPAPAGSLRVIALQCAERPAPEADWDAACIQPVDGARFQLTGLDGPFAEWSRTLVADSDGVTVLDGLPPARYRLVQDHTDWCRAESDRVDDGGNVVIQDDLVTTVWVFNCPLGVAGS